MTLPYYTPPFSCVKNTAFIPVDLLFPQPASSFIPCFRLIQCLICLLDHSLNRFFQILDGNTHGAGRRCSYKSTFLLHGLADIFAFFHGCLCFHIFHDHNKFITAISGQHIRLPCMAAQKAAKPAECLITLPMSLSVMDPLKVIQIE